MLDGVLFFPVTPFSPFEVACLDVQGKLLGRPVSDLLGGAVRDSVPFSAYLFYKWRWLGSPVSRLSRDSRPCAARCWPYSA
jgi:L-alanine-DL-glutamate epimerase-like enolase superfamily enzyme